MIIPVKTQLGKYDIILERGSLKRSGDYFALDRKVLVVTDSGVPEEYSNTVASCCEHPVIVTIEQGERSKNLDTYKYLLEKLVENNFTRTDCVVAVGGGVVGDLAGFVSSSYMRGIDFYNIPTTVLSQVDSSIGGKTAVDFMGLKNIVGAFYQPKGVLIDSDVLKTLPDRQISNGLSEALKSALIGDKELFDIFENEDIMQNIDKIIERSLMVKKKVVEQDEKECGLRKILNFGHTLGHAVESVNSLDKYYHGECVAIGMIPMCSEQIRIRVLPILKKLGLPTETDYTAEQLIDICRHDKKTDGDSITVVKVNTVGKAELEKMSFSDYEKLVKEVI